MDNSGSGVGNSAALNIRPRDFEALTDAQLKDCIRALGRKINSLEYSNAGDIYTLNELQKEQSLRTDNAP